MNTQEMPPVSELEVFASDLNVHHAADIYKKHGCIVVRSLMKPYIDAIARDIENIFRESLNLLPRAEKVPEGWKTPNGALFIPAPKNFDRDQQIMVLPCTYQRSAAFFRSAFDPRAIELVTAILGPDVELQSNGQCLYKEPVGGHPKHLHQDSAYFEHKYEGPVAILSYVVDTNLQNGALHVVPGSHNLGQLKHVDTFSHLGLEEKEWPWERALPIEGNAGDSIFFNVKTIHGSKENHSDKARPVFIHRYRRADDYIVVGATTAANRAEAEKKAATMNKKSQEGFMVSGLRKFVE